MLFLALLFAVSPTRSASADEPAADIAPASFTDGEDRLSQSGLPVAAMVGDPSQFSAGFDDGFFIRPNDLEETPFDLKFNLQGQFRYTGFAAAVNSWTDSAGNTFPIGNRSNFEIPRGRVLFSGHALLPQLTYMLNVDYNTVSTSQINFRAYWLGYRFSRGCTVYIGQNKVPGSREWLTSYLSTQGPDRSMATTFFRPSLSQGIWITGEPVDGFHYYAMMSNGFNTLGTNPDQISSRMTFSGSAWFEPLGEFGPGYSDFEWHEDPAVRWGASLTYSPMKGQQGNPDLPENADIRLTNGTLLTQTGALAPGVTLNIYTAGLAAIDLAYKHRGFSVSGEMYFRDLFDLAGNGPIPRHSIFDYGGFAQCGYFVVPQKCEIYARTSQITGPFGYGSEYAGGANWFLLPGKQNLKLTFDVAWLNHNPADQNRTDYLVGETGLLLRTQFQTFF